MHQNPGFDQFVFGCPDAIEVENKACDSQGHFVPAGAGEDDVSVSVPLQGVSQVIAVTVVNFNHRVCGELFL
jgi:hypothetical protein